MLVSGIVDERELPQRFQKVFNIAPENAWRRRAQVLADRDPQNPFLTEYFDERYAIERSLVRALDHRDASGRFPTVRGPQGRQYFELYSFIHALSSVYARLSLGGQSRVRGNLRDGLRSDNGLAPFAHELAVPVHLWSAGFDVEFTDIEGRSRFDILARKEGLELEVDCKTASGDVGRQIHRHRALELFNRISPALERFLERNGGGRTIDTILPGRLHGAQMNAVEKAVAEAVSHGKSLYIDDVADVILGAFDLREEPSLLIGRPTREDLDSAAIRRLGRTNVNVICVGRPRRTTAVIVAVSSRKPDKVEDGIYRALKDSAAGQFSGNDPVLLACRLLDLTMVQLRDLASTGGLNKFSHHLLASDSRAHLFGVAFVSPAGIEFSDKGMALLFKRKEHPLAQDPRLLLFSPRSKACQSS
jgi:hypothetical protein